MGSFAQARDAGRLVVHATMSRPALYIDGVATPVPLQVRLHDKFTALGEVKGTSVDYAEKEDVLPRLVFLRADVPVPARNAFVMFAADEGYSIDHAMPFHGITVEAKATRLVSAQLVGKPYPGDNGWPLDFWV